jgi:Flp pilus assembly protein TadG
MSCQPNFIKEALGAIALKSCATSDCGVALFGMRSELRGVFSRLAGAACAALRHFAGDAAAGLAVSTAIASPAVMGAVGLASDFAFYSMRATELQAAADAAAIAATRELAVYAGQGMASMAHDGDATSDPFSEIARSYVKAALNLSTDEVSTTVEVDQATGSVHVTVTNYWRPFFAHYLGADLTPIVSDARASLSGQTNVCVLALNPSERGAISLNRGSTLQANSCSVYSNSTNSSGVTLGSGSTIEADLVCSAGGVDNRGGAATTEIVTDCPPMPDPLAGRAPPTVGACDAQDFAANIGDVTLSPGVYCGGMAITGTARARLEPGNYFIGIRQGSAHWRECCVLSQGRPCHDPLPGNRGD